MVVSCIVTAAIVHVMHTVHIGGRSAVDLTVQAFMSVHLKEIH